MSLATRKPFLGNSDQIMLKPAYSATECSLNIGSFAYTSFKYSTFQKANTKALIRLGLWACWSAGLLAHARGQYTVKPV